MRRALVHASIVSAILLFTVAVNLSYVGMWIHLAGRWMWREHDKFLRWFHWELCGDDCPHWEKRDE